MRNRLAKRRSHDRKGACRLLLPLLLATLPALQAAAQEVVEVEARRNSPLTGDATIGQERRLLFVTSTTTDATSDDIDDYNDHVIAAARDGIEAIRPHAGLFRAWVSTPTVDARDNANLKFGSLAPVHWLGSLQRIGINGADMYDAVWLNAGGHDENGNRLAPDLGLPRGQNRYIWTGSDNNGTRWCNSQKTVCFGLGDGIRAHAGDLKMVNPLSSTPKDSINEYPLYAVSPIFRAVPVVSIDLGRAAGVVDRTVNLNLRVRGLGVAATTKTEVRIRVTDDPLVDLLKASDEGTRDITVTGTGHTLALDTREDYDARDAAITVEVLDRPGYVLGPSPSKLLTLPDQPDFNRILKPVKAVTAKEGAGKATVRLELDQGITPQEAKFKVSAVQAGGSCKATATAGTDYETPGAGPVTINSSSRHYDFQLNLKDDALNEKDEVVCLKIHSPEKMVLGKGSPEAVHVAVTIEDDDPLPVISVSSPTATEGAGTLDFEFSLNQTPLTGDVQVHYGDSGLGTAKAGDDYEPLTPGTLTFADGGARTATVSVSLKDDGVEEPTETVVLRVNQPENATLAGGGRNLWPTGMIAAPPERAPRLELRPREGKVVVREGGTARLIFELWRGGERVEAPETIGFSLFIGGGTATLYADYRSVSRRASLRAGESSVALEVPIVADSVDEPVETFEFGVGEIFNTRYTGRFSNARVTVEIYDGPALLSIGDAPMRTEGRALTFPVSIGPAMQTGVNIPWKTETAATQSATAGEDYKAASGTLTIAAGATGGTIRVETLDDSVDEPDQDFSVVITDPNVAGLDVSRARATGVIGDNDKPPKISMSGAEAVEGQKIAFAFSLSEAAERPVELRWLARAGSGDPPIATRGADYAGEPSGDISIAPGRTGATLEFATIDDAEDEPDEWLILDLFDASRGMLEMGSVRARIRDNDLPTLTVADARVTEGAAARMNFPVRLSRAQESVVTVELRTEDGSARSDGAAVRGTRDYVPLARTLTFRPGQRELTVQVGIVDDGAVEDAETFRMVLSGARGAEIGRAGGIGTIEDDDRVYRFAGGPLTVVEGGTITVAVRSDARFGAEHPAYACLSNTGAGAGHATVLPDDDANSDIRLAYLNTDQSSNCRHGGWRGSAVDLGTGGHETRFSVTAIDDASPEGEETVRIEVMGLQGLNRIGAEITIVDNDIPRIRIESVNSPWEGEKAEFAIFVDSIEALGNSSSKTVTVSTSDGSAGAPGDYVALPGRTVALTAPASVDRPAATFTVDTVEDEVYESDETFTAALSAPPAGFAVDRRRGAAAATIRDDDGTEVYVEDAVVEEGESARIVIRQRGGLQPKAFTMKISTVGETADIYKDTFRHEGTPYKFDGSTRTLVQRLRTIDDDEHEGDETYRLVIDEVDHPDVRIGRAGTVTIRDNDAPALAISGVSDAKAPENAAWTSPAPSLTGDASGDVVWSLKGADAAAFTVDPDTGVFSMPARNFESPADSNKDNSYLVTLVATDAEGTTAAVDVKVDVTDVTFGTLDFLHAVGNTPARNPAIELREGAPVSFFFQYFDSAWISGTGRPNAVELAWEIVLPAAGAGAAAADDVTLNGRGGPQRVLRWVNAGSSTVRVDVADIVQDLIDEQDEAFGIRFSVDNDDVRIFDFVNKRYTDSVEVLIKDDDGRAVVAYPGRLTLAESNDPRELGDERTRTYNVVLGSQPTGTVTVSLSAGRNAPVTLSTASLTFDADDWDDPQPVTVTAVADDIENEGGKRTATVRHTASGADYGAAEAATVEVTVTDDDGPPLISIDAPEVTEGDDSAKTLTFTVSLSHASDGPVTVEWADAGSGTALPGFDYRALAGGTLSIAAGDTSGTIGVTVIGDLLDEADETVAIELSSPANARLSNGEATLKGAGTILDNDPTPSVSLEPGQTVDEGDPDGIVGKAIRFFFKLSAASGRDVTVPFSLGGTATAGTDYTAPDPLSFTIRAGTTSGSLNVLLVSDLLDEDDETVILTLGTPVNATVGTADGAGRAVGTIRDDDDLPVLSIDAPRATEGDDSEAALTFTVKLTPASGRAVTVDWADALTGTASSGVDYDPLAGGTLTFAAGDTSKSIPVSVTGDTLDEEDETVVVRLSLSEDPPANATFAGDATTLDGTGTIEDNDPLPLLSVADAEDVLEGDNPNRVTEMTFPVSLSAASAKKVSVNYSFGIRSPGSPATVGTDFREPAPGTTLIVIDAGERQATVEVLVKGDVEVEDNEIVTVRIGGPTNARVAPGGGAADGIILNDDGSALSIDDVTAAEGATADFTVSLSTPSATDVTVTATTSVESGDTASAADYTHKTQELTIAAGDTSAAFSVTILEDMLDEPDETFAVKLASPSSGGALLDDTGIGAIEDDDATTVTLTVPDAAATEGSAEETAEITLTLNRGLVSGESLGVPLAFADGVAGTDFSLALPSVAPAGVTFSGTTVTFTGPGMGATAASATLTLTASNDADTTDDTVTVSIPASHTATGQNDPVLAASGLGGGAAGSRTGDGVITLLDGADAGVTVAETGAGTEVTEAAGTGNTDTYTLVLAAAPRNDVTVTVTPEAGLLVDGPDAAAAGAAGETLTFTPRNWNAPQTVTVFGVDDDIDQGASHTLTIEHAAASDDPRYDELGIEDVEVTVTDDEATPTATLALTPPTIAESGQGNASTVTATLSGASDEAVTLTVSVPNASPVTLAGSALTIEVGSTGSTGTVTVTAVDNSADAPNAAVTVSATASGGGVEDPDDATVTITDDDATTVTLTTPDTSAIEGSVEDTAKITLTLNRGLVSGESLGIPLAFAGGVSGTDFTLALPKARRPPASR